jgi:magnesium chelatase family protein
VESAVCAGALPIAIEARGKKIAASDCSELNAREAAMVGGVEVYPVRSLLDVIRFVNTGNGIMPLKVDSDTLLSEAQHYAVDLKDVRGQHTASVRELHSNQRQYHRKRSFQEEFWRF